MNTDEKNICFPRSQGEFESIYSYWCPVLSSYALKFVGEHTAQDIVQDLFLSLWSNPPTLKVSLQSYMFAAVRNACLDHLKGLKVRDKFIDHRLVRLQTEEIEYYQTNETSILEQEQIDLIYSAIENLPEKCKEIFKMSYFQNMKSSEIAEELDLSIRTVQNQLYKGLVRLRDVVKERTKNGILLLVWSVLRVVKCTYH